MLRPERAALGPERTVLGLERSGLASEPFVLGLERTVLGEERRTLGPERSFLPRATFVPHSLRRELDRGRQPGYGDLGVGPQDFLTGRAAGDQAWRRARDRE